MADIAMCKNADCKKKESCYRFKATPCPYRQSYGFFSHKDGECEYYLEIKLPNKNNEL